MDNPTYRARVILQKDWNKQDEWSEKNIRAHAMTHMGDRILIRPYEVDRVPMVGEWVTWDEGWATDTVKRVTWEQDGTARIELGPVGEWGTEHGLRDWIEAGWTIEYGDPLEDAAQS